MDVHCTTCGEPWDVYHLRHDAIYETDLSHAEAKAWTQLSPQVKLLDRYREKFKAIGFEFGGSIAQCHALSGVSQGRQARSRQGRAQGRHRRAVGRRRGCHC